MAKHKLTITDLETGKVEIEKTCDGILGAVISRSTGEFSAPTSFGCMFQLPNIDIISLLTALDTEKEHLLATKPVIARLYDMRDMLFSKRVDVDITALKKQMGVE